MNTEPQTIVRTVYLYLVTFIGLILLVVGIVDLVEYLLALALPDKTPTSDEYHYYGSLRSGIAYILIGAPLWLYHWRIIQGKSGFPKATSSAS